MSLPAGERRKLRRIEREAVTADPGLAARFSMFNRLSQQEDMPRTERLRWLGFRRKRWAGRRIIIAYLMSGTDKLLQEPCQLKNASAARKASVAIAAQPARTRRLFPGFPGRPAFAI